MKSFTKKSLNPVHFAGIYAIIVFILITLIPGIIFAQWNTNTSVNIPISNLEVADMETAPTTDGKTWIAFYVQNSGNYDMYAQLIDANGYKLLGTNGMLVSSQTSGSATFVFNVCVDAANNLIIANQDERTGTMQAVVYKISQAGTHLWAATGIILGEGLAPYPAVLSTGETVVAWNGASNTLNLQKISAAGTTVWSSPITVLVGTSTTTRGQVIGNTGGKFTMVYQKRGFGISTSLYAQMFDNAGTALYTALQICNETTSGARYYSIAGSADTTYFGYYSSTGNRFNSYVQRINPGGTIPWGMNGSNFNTQTGTNDNYQGQTAINVAAGSGYVWSVCTFSDPNQTQYGIYIQKFLRSTGARQFTDLGKVVYAISGNSDQEWGDLALINDTPMFMIEDVNYKLYATRLDASGNFVWPGNRVEISSTTATMGTPKMRNGFTPDGPNRCAGTWTENRGSFYMGYAQGISVGGLIGVVVATQGGVPATITSPGGTLQMVATVFPSTASQTVTWSIVPGTGGATITPTGLVTANLDGTVYAKAVAVQDPTVKDSMLITITGQVPLAPTVVTLAATPVAGVTATINGSVTANNATTTVTFQWGLTTSYSNTVSATPGIVNGTTPTAVLANLTSLTPLTTYHYRCVGVNSVGTTYGLDMTFTTCQPPDAAGSITGPASVCQGQTGVVYSTATIPFATTYVWTVPTGASIVGGIGTNSITVNYANNASSGNVTVAGSNTCTTGTPATLAVTVNTIPIPTITGPAEACVGAANVNYSTEPGMTGYTWTISAGGTIVNGAGTNTIEVQWNTAGPQTLTVNYTNAGGCQAQNPASYSVTVSIIPADAGPITGENSLCAGTQGVPYSVELITGATTYVWTVPAGATIMTGSGTSAITVDFATTAVSGPITVSGNSVCGNGAASSLDVTVKPIPETPVVDSNGFVLTSSAATGNQWYKDGELIVGATGQEYTVEQNGWYWTIVTIDGCSSAESNHIYILVTGTENHNGPDFSIYPIPNNGRFDISITSPVSSTCTLEIYNILGARICQLNDISVNGTFKKTVDLRPIPDGVYHIVLKDSGNQVVRKFIVKGSK
jgi:hypothetical protein